MSDDIEDIVAMARAAQRDERLSDGPLYGKLADEIERLRSRVEVMERLTRESLNVLTCDGGDDDPGHRCSHCDDYVDRNRQHRKALRAALEAKP